MTGCSAADDWVIRENVLAFGEPIPAERKRGRLWVVGVDDRLDAFEQLVDEVGIAWRVGPSMRAAPVANVDGAESDRDANRGLPCAERLKRGSLDAGDLGPPAAGQLDHQVCSSQACRISQYRPLRNEVSAAYRPTGLGVWT